MLWLWGTKCHSHPEGSLERPRPFPLCQHHLHHTGGCPQSGGWRGWPDCRHRYSAHPPPQNSGIRHKLKGTRKKALLIFFICTYREGMVNTELVNSSTVDTGLQQLRGFSDTPIYALGIRYRKVMIRKNCPDQKPEPPGRCPQSRPRLPGERGGEL